MNLELRADYTSTFRVWPWRAITALGWGAFDLRAFDATTERAFSHGALTGKIRKAAEILFGAESQKANAKALREAAERRARGERTFFDDMIDRMRAAQMREP
jgi:hypothetical protein